MRRLWLMVKKDLLRTARTPFAVLLILAFPILVALVMVAAFGDGQPGLPKIKLLIENRDGDLLGTFLTGAFDSENLAKYFDVEVVGEEGRQRIEKGEASALLILPKGFTQAFIEGSDTTLELVRNPSEGIRPVIAEETVGILAELADIASRTLREPLDQISARKNQDFSQVPEAEFLSVALQMRQAVLGAEKYLFPPAMVLESEQQKPEEQNRAQGFGTIFLEVFPGLAVFALFMVGDRSMKDLLTEGSLGTLQRMAAGPVTAGTIVAAKALSTAALAGVSLVILAAIAWMISTHAIDFFAFLVLGGSLLLAISGFFATSYGLARTERQGSTISNVLLLVMAMLGGSFIPADNLPAALRQFSPLSLFYWPTEGFRSLLREGGKVADILTNAGVLALVGSVLLVLGSMLLSRRIRRGAV